MSAFLGPIHYWLYRKIQLQEEFTTSLLESYDEVKTFIDRSVGTVETRALEEVIDTGNIHGWLQTQILIAEDRYALTITHLLKEERLSLDDLCEKAISFGKQHSIRKDTAPEIFKEFQDLFLDGMPCDHVNKIVEQEDKKIVVEQTRDLHSIHWEKAGGKGEHYYRLREAMLQGMLNESPFTYSVDGNCFTIFQ